MLFHTSSVRKETKSVFIDSHGALMKGNSFDVDHVLTKMRFVATINTLNVPKSYS